MSIVAFLLTSGCVALVCWLVWRFVPIAIVKTILLILILVLYVLWALRVLGFLDTGALTVGG